MGGKVCHSASWCTSLHPWRDFLNECPKRAHDAGKTEMGTSLPDERSKKLSCKTRSPKLCFGFTASASPNASFLLLKGWKTTIRQPPTQNIQCGLLPYTSYFASSVSFACRALVGPGSGVLLPLSQILPMEHLPSALTPSRTQVLLFGKSYLKRIYGPTSEITLHPIYMSKH